MRKHQCMHCADPGCLAACPADGAIVQYANGIVDFQQEYCIGCQFCVSGCPFNVPKFNESTKKVYKCTLCSDRVEQGLEPACIKACPTGCLHFGTKDDMKALAETRATQLRDHSGFKDAGVYDPETIGGTSVIYVLHDAKNTEKYGEPTVEAAYPRKLHSVEGLVQADRPGRLDDGTGRRCSALCDAGSAASTTATSGEIRRGWVGVKEGESAWQLEQTI